MTRARLPERRQGETVTLVYHLASGGEIAFAATFNSDESGRVREVFCLAFKEGTDLRTLLHHACIVTSVALQHGATMHGLAHALGEENTEILPASIMALIVRAGVVVDEKNGFGRPNLEAQP